MTMKTEEETRRFLSFTRQFVVGLLFLTLLVGATFTAHGWWDVWSVGVWITSWAFILIGLVLLRSIEPENARDSGKQHKEPS